MCSFFNGNDMSDITIVEEHYFHIQYEDVELRLHLSDGNYMGYFIPKLIKQGLKQHHLGNAKGRFMQDITISKVGR